MKLINLRDYDFPILWHENCVLALETKKSVIKYHEIADHYVIHSIEKIYPSNFLRRLKRDLTS